MALTKKEREDLKKATEKLITLDLPIPQKVKTFYKKKVEPSIGSGYEFADVIVNYKGRMLQRIFCFQLHGGRKKRSVIEVARRYEGGEVILSNLYKPNYMRSYVAYDADCSGNYISGWNPEYAWNNGRKRWHCMYPAFNLNEEQVMKQYPYCAWNEYTGNLLLFEYICIYKKCPKIELLVKAGYSKFVGLYRKLNFKGKNFRDIFGVRQEFAKEYLKSSSSSVNDLTILKNNEWISSEDMLKKYKSSLYAKYYDFTEEDIKYVTLSNSTYSTYRDYISMAEKLGYPLNERKYKYPKDLIKAHDKAADEVTVMTDKENDIKIAEVKEICRKLEYSNDKFTIFPASCTLDLINESKALDHCVRTYAERVAAHTMAIFFVRKTEDAQKPFVTLELRNTKNTGKYDRFNEIVQARGYHNARPDEETKQFILDWKRKYKLKGWDNAA